ncbi:ABC transporter ATP-binding protein [Dehalococcoidia bacterium]|nr:ABC transporter ATP-binding protein [Dehalococcoidia bacterium]
MSFVQIESLTKKFGDLTAVNDVSFEIEKGETVGLLGPNGAGKSTTIDIIVGLRKPTSGRVLVHGFEPSKNGLEVRRAIGYVPQRAAIFEDLSVRENLSLAAEMYGIPRFKHRVAEIIKEFELEEKADKLAGTLSGGQKSRLNFALGCIIADSQLIILDEPTVGLDHRRRMEAWGFVRRLHGSGKAVLLTTHYMEEADALCSRILLMDRGKIVAQGSPQQLKSTLSDELVVEYMFAEAPPRDLVQRITALPNVIGGNRNELSLRVTLKSGALPQVRQLVHESKLLIRSSSEKAVTLDDVFRHYTGSELREKGE